MNKVHGLTTMKAMIRYLSHDIAEQFGSRSNREVVNLPDDATYKDLIDLLQKRYEKTESVQEMFDTLFFVCEGRPLRAIGDKSINPDREVLVAHKVFGG